MFRNVHRTCWNKYLDKLKQKLNQRILQPVPMGRRLEKNYLFCEPCFLSLFRS